MEQERLKAEVDEQLIESAIKNNPNHNAIVINLRVVTRMLNNFPERFTKTENTLIYKDNVHVYFHNEGDNIVRTKKAVTD